MARIPEVPYESQPNKCSGPEGSPGKSDVKRGYRFRQVRRVTGSWPSTD